MIPEASLALQYKPMSPPIPDCFVVVIDKKVVATVTLEHFKAMAERLKKMEDDR